MTYSNRQLGNQAAAWLASWLTAAPKHTPYKPVLLYLISLRRVRSPTCHVFSLCTTCLYPITSQGVPTLGDAPAVLTLPAPHRATAYLGAAAVVLTCLHTKH